MDRDKGKVRKKRKCEQAICQHGKSEFNMERVNSTWKEKIQHGKREFNTGRDQRGKRKDNSEEKNNNMGKGT